MTKVKMFFKGILYILLYFFLQILLYSTFYSDIYNNTNTYLANCATIFVDLLILFIFILIFRKILVPNFNEFKSKWKELIKNNFKYWAIGLFLMVFTNLVINIFVGSMPTNEEINRMTLFSMPISSIISMVIIGPIIEELITRGAFKDVFKNKYTYIIFSGILFGLLHLLSISSIKELLYIIPYAALGCSFAKMYYDTDNIWTNIFFHSFHNFIAIILIFVGV